MHTLPLCVVVSLSLVPLAAQQDWRPAFPTTQPGWRNGNAMAFDAARAQLVLFGGQTPTATLMNDTWTWNGSAWTQQAPATSPIARQSHAMCYDAARQRVVLFGGQNGPTSLRDTWEWDGTNWSQRTTPTALTARSRSALAFDGARSILFGGVGAAVFGDTWALDGTGWTQLSPATSPSARSSFAMASDGAGTVLLFGGQVGGQSNETWSLVGTTWTQLTPTAPPSPRANSAMVWDPVSARYVLFSGSNSFFQAIEDTWAFAGGQWTQLPTSPTRAPSSRSLCAAAWFAPQQRFVLQGGTPFQAVDLRSTPMWEFGSSLASFAPFGPSLCPSIDPPLLRGTSQPRIGGTLAAEIFSFSAVHGFVLMGFSTTAWSGGALPFDLAAIGTQPNCMLRVSPDVSLYLGFGQTTTWSLPIPNVPAYVGQQFFVQGFTFGAGTFPTNLSTANAATAVVGIN